MHPGIATSASAAGEATERRRTVCRGLPRRERREGGRGSAQTPWPHLSSRAGPRPGDRASIRDHMLAHHDRHQPGRLHRPHAARRGSGSHGNAPCKIDFRVSGEDMSFSIAAFLLIPLADQAIKALLRRRLGERAVSLGPFGSLRVIDTPIWWARGGLRPTPVMLWIAWLAGPGALLALAPRLPGCEWCAALLLGGSLSHMIETSRRGRVCDYLCLRFWPAFNLADAAISIGTVGFIVRV